jgi:cytochrome P450
MSALAAEHAERWSGLVAQGKPVDVLAEMMTLTLRVVSRALLSAEVGGEAGRVGTALGHALGWANDQLTSPWSVVPRTVPIPRNRRIKAAIGALDEVVLGIIRERRAGTADPADLLSLLMAARDEETGEGMNDTQLRDEVMTIFLAGHETTANLLAWTFSLLSRFPSAGRALRGELASVLGGRPATFADLPKLAQTRRVLDEALRLYPPAWSFGRLAEEADELGGFHIPKGSLVILNPYITHRLPEHWPDPEGFDPDRFEPARFDALPRFAYLPFGGGPRQCIGNSFALMEGVILLATLAQKFRPELLPGHAVELDPGITLRPKGGLPMRLHLA